MIRSRLPALVALVVLACGGRRAYAPSPGPYDRIGATGLELMSDACRRLAVGDLDGAESLLFELLELQPRYMNAAILLQELELERLQRAGSSLERARRELAERALEFAERHAEEHERLIAWLLHARLAPDRETATPSLDRAAAIDPRNVWVAYGRAWWAYHDRDFKTARERVREAFAIDGGHLETLRLHARLEAGGGQTKQAIDALRTWIARASQRPSVTPERIAAAEIDLAALLVTEEQPDEALELLATLDVAALPDRERARAELVRAAAFEGAELDRLALRSAERAGRLDRENLLPYVHRAMLLDISDPDAAEETWRELLELAERQRRTADTDEERGFQPLLLELRARYEVALAERRRAERESESNLTR
ncbi:MAG: hypothetical protein WD226_01490 [Planctomycetota bacterium]